MGLMVLGFVLVPHIKSNYETLYKFMIKLWLLSITEGSSLDNFEEGKKVK